MGYATLFAEKARKKEELRLETLERARRAATELRKQFVFNELYVIGSVLGRRFRLTSDLDLVISGIAMEDFGRAHGFLMTAVGGRVPVDLKALEEMPEAIRRSVRERGLRIA